MSGNSSVGTRAVYEAGDQRNVKQLELSKAERYDEGKENSHLGKDSSTPSPRRAKLSMDADFHARGPKIHCQPLSG